MGSAQMNIPSLLGLDIWHNFAVSHLPLMIYHERPGSEKSYQKKTIDYMGLLPGCKLSKYLVSNASLTIFAIFISISLLLKGMSHARF
jgi:hypothetical protein